MSVTALGRTAYTAPARVRSDAKLPVWGRVLVITGSAGALWAAIFAGAAAALS